MTRTPASAAIAGRAKRLRNRDGHHGAAEAFVETVHGRVIDVLPILTPGFAYGRHDLCGQAFIARLTARRRRTVDLCLAALAARGALPLERVRDAADGPPRYRLI